MVSETALHADTGVDVIIRFHDVSRLKELERSAFSVAGQEYGPVRIVLVTQRFSEAAQQAARKAVEDVIAWSRGVCVCIFNHEAEDPVDARSELVNIGFANATGRYLALLDYDDVLYPEAYRLLVEQLQKSGAAVAFARTPVVWADVHESFVHARNVSYPFHGENLPDLFTSNFCPIHSYLMDRRLISPSVLRFEPRLTIEEDYDFLLRLCASQPADFTLRKTEIGLYFYKNDDSNTFSRNGPLLPDVAERNDTAQQFVELRRRMTPIAPTVQNALGIRPVRAGLTIREYLKLRTEGLA